MLFYGVEHHYSSLYKQKISTLIKQHEGIQNESHYKDLFRLRQHFVHTYLGTVLRPQRVHIIFTFSKMFSFLLVISCWLMGRLEHSLAISLLPRGASLSKMLRNLINIVNNVDFHAILLLWKIKLNTQYLKNFEHVFNRGHM